MSLSLLTRSYLASLVTEGLLSGNNLLFEGQPVGGGDVNPPEELSSDWDWGTRHPESGCPASFRIQKLKNDLVNLGLSPMARVVPDWHCGDFWRDDDYEFSFATGGDRFTFPPELLNDYHQTQDTAALITSNLLALNSRLFLLAMNGGDTRIRNMYRGEANGIGFDRLPATWGNGLDRGLNLNPNYTRPGIPFEFNGPDPSRHFVYDIYFDMFDDNDVVRYWTSWARAHGANV